MQSGVEFLQGNADCDVLLTQNDDPKYEVKFRNLSTSTSVASAINPKSKTKSQTSDDIDINSDYFPPLEIVWRNVILFAYLHMAALYGIYLLLSLQLTWKTFVFGFFLAYCGGFGITAGAHRLWSHKAYKAKLPLRLILALMQTVALQNSLHEWCRDHRVHHKFTETHADPHNARRGFWFAHMGWLLCRKHPAVKIKGSQIDMSDLEADPIIMFQKRHYVPLALTVSILIPGVIPWCFWGESFLGSFCFAGIFRLCLSLHFTWLVNSAAHLWGGRPYDKTINPAENKLVAALALGEGWHNYHHTFPWDYKTAELGGYSYNITTAFVNFFAAIGWAYDLKTVPENIVQQRVARTGDGSHSHHGEFKSGPWGWGDKDIAEEDAAVTETLYAQKEE